MEKDRLDVLMVSRGLAESRSLAQRLIMAGQVRVAGQVCSRPADRFAAEVDIIVDQGPRFVSRGGEKLDAALNAFALIDLTGLVCADIGASTGGFTDCLLQHGARRVYSVDVGYGVLHWKMRNDARVVSMERTNARFVQGFPEQIQLVTVDVSFISLRIILPVVSGWFGNLEGRVVALIKPQFEAGRIAVARGEGVVKDPAVHRQVLLGVLDFAQQQGYGIKGLIQSPLLGPKGNTEFLVHLVYPGHSVDDYVELVESIIEPRDAG
jgi:23S rRNA (cytidine1920-2'-O)/16S rRNA (cytidine1409-2'-O)-methyltransferase